MPGPSSLAGYPRRSMGKLMAFSGAFSSGNQGKMEHYRTRDSKRLFVEDIREIGVSTDFINDAPGRGLQTVNILRWEALLYGMVSMC